MQVHTTVERVSDEYVRKQGWEVVWSPDEPAAPEPAHRLVIEDGSVMFECHAPADAPCRAVYDCGCEEWFAVLARQLDQARGLAARLWDELAQAEPKISGTHSRDACQGSGCVVHHPSDHAMRDWPLQPRPDRRMVERTCPHGVGHPDPDDAAYRASRGDTDSVHGCDGCCRTGGVVS